MSEWVGVRECFVRRLWRELWLGVLLSTVHRNISFLAATMYTTYPQKQYLEICTLLTYNSIVYAIDALYRERCWS